MAEYVCPNCKKPIYDDEALMCLYCGESLRRSAGFLGKLKYSPLKVILVVIIVIISLAFLFLIIK